LIFGHSALLSFAAFAFGSTSLVAPGGFSDFNIKETEARQIDSFVRNALVSIPA